MFGQDLTYGTLSGPVGRKGTLAPDLTFFSCTSCAERELLENKEGQAGGSEQKSKPFISLSDDTSQTYRSPESRC